MLFLDAIKIKYEIKKIIYKNNETGFLIALIKIKEHPKSVEIPTSETIVRGRFNGAHPRDEFISIGHWKDYGESGYQFNAITSSLILPETDKGLVRFLENFASGIGSTVAKRVVESFGAKTLKVIRNEPDSLLGIQGVTEKKVEAMRKAVVDHKDFEDVVFYLMSLGLNYSDSSGIYEQFGYSSIDKTKENPYFLMDHTKLSFNQVDTLAKNIGISPDNENRIKRGILEFISSEMKNKGDIFVFENKIYEEIEIFMATNGSFGEQHIKKKALSKALKDLIALKKITLDYNKNSETCVYFSYYHHIELEIAKMLQKMTKEPSLPICLSSDIPSMIEDYQAKTGSNLATKQKMAIRMALSNRISVLTGGPGTGKTHTINAIINIAKNAKKDSTIELCAPTGRAAKRMTELTGMNAQTIHRLIGLNAFEEGDTTLNEIDADLMIVDESSMVDAFLFYSLLRSLSENTRLLIVGDHEQLPSVGPGLILRDLIDSATVPVTILDEIFRQSKNSQIVLNSHKLIKGVKTTDPHGITFDPSIGDFYFINRLEKEKVSQGILQSIDRLLSRGFKLNEIQVLSVMNKGDLGVIELNRKIQSRYNKSSVSVDVGDNKILKLNDRVIQNVNNYDLCVYNGETGTIESIVEDESDLEVIVNYGDKDVTYSWENIEEISLSYAMTVHKSQGSEFKIVIMPIHSSLSILLNRNLVYTGLTRAKERVVLIGDLNEFNKSIDRMDITHRNSMIKERLIR